LHPSTLRPSSLQRTQFAALAAIASLNVETVAPPKKICKTPAQAQQDRINQKTRRDKEKNARKMASRLHQQEMKNKDEGKPYTVIGDTIKRVKEECSTASSATTICKDSADGRAGMSPEKKRGRPGNLDELDYGLVSDAFVTCCRINQLNADPSMNTKAQFATHLASVFGKKDQDCSLLDRILRDTAID